MDFKTLQIETKEGVARVMLNRPDKANAMIEAMWHELRDAMRWADETKEVRVVVIGGNGKHFTAGIDLSMLMNLNANLQDDCVGRAREKLRRFILDLQDTLTSIERGGIDLITACDMLYCSTEAYFCVKEIDVGMAADVGTLQRLPHVVGDGMTRELVYTGRRVDGAEAQNIHLVNRCFESTEALRHGVHEIAKTIAAKSPLSIRGCK